MHVGIPAVHLLILQPGVARGFPRFCLSWQISQTHSVSILGLLWACGVNLVSCSSLLRPPATPLDSNSPPPRVLWPAKILSSAAAVSISSSSLQAVTPVTLCGVSDGPTGESINAMINPPFHVTVFRHSFTTMGFEGDNPLPFTHKKNHTSILHLSQPSFTDVQQHR